MRVAGRTRARELGMAALIEVHNPAEFALAQTTSALNLIGINNRDLHTFKTDIAMTEELLRGLSRRRADRRVRAESRRRNISAGSTRGGARLSDRREPAARRRTACGAGAADPGARSAGSCQPMSVRVKICGVTRVADAECAITLGADMIGLNFYPPSPRCADSRTRARECAPRSAIAVRSRAFSSMPSASYIAERLDALRLDWLQFHGDEPDDALRGWPVKVIRALRLRAAATPAALARGQRRLRPGRYVPSRAVRRHRSGAAVERSRRCRSQPRLYLRRPDRRQRCHRGGARAVRGRRRQRGRVRAGNQGCRKIEEFYRQCKVCPISTGVSASTAAATSRRP